MFWYGKYRSYPQVLRPKNAYRLLAILVSYPLSACAKDIDAIMDAFNQSNATGRG